MATKFEIEGKPYLFNFAAFNRLFIAKWKTSKVSKSEYEEQLADIAGVSKSSIHAYFFSKNGPGDIAIVKAISDYWKIDIHYLLCEEKSSKMEKLNDREKEAVRRIYVVICDFMEKFVMSDGLFMIKPDGTRLGEEKQGDYVHYSFSQVELAYDKEYIDLSKHPIYEELRNYIDKDLSEMYEEKCDCSIRFEPEELGGISASHDYLIARENLLKLIDKYI